MNSTITNIRKILRDETAESSDATAIFDTQEFQGNFADFKKSCFDVFFSKKQKRYLLKFDEDDYENVDYHQFRNAHEHINTFINVSFKGKRVSTEVLKDNEKNQTCEYSNFGKSILYVIRQIAMRLQHLNLPYSKLKYKVHVDDVLIDLVKLLNNLVLIFPVQLVYILDTETETYMYYFFLPGFDCFRLCTPIQLPVIDPIMCAFNYSYVKTLIGDFNYQPLFVQQDITLLINRCMYGFKTLPDIKYQVSKNAALFSRLFISAQSYFGIPARKITLFFKKVLARRSFVKTVSEKIKEVLKKKQILKTFVSQICKPIIKKQMKKMIKAVNCICHWFKHKRFIQSILDYAQSLRAHEAAIRIHGWIKHITYIKSILKYAYNLRLEINLKKMEKERQENSNNLKQLIKKKKNERQRENKNNQSLVSKWFGFNNNVALERLILAVGETHDILDITSVEFKTEQYWRVKECLGKLCLRTGSRQYIKFCRQISQTTSKGTSETVPEFLSCFCPESVSMLDYLREAVLVSSICRNKWGTYLVNNFQQADSSILKL